MSGKSRFVAASDGVRLHVEVHPCATRSRPSCLLLHGFGDGAYVWEETCAALREICPVAAVDLRGHGDSEHSQSGTYDLNTNIQDVIQIITRLGIAPAIVVGHSFGGEIALRIAARPPVPVFAAVFVDVAPEVDQQTSRQATVHMMETLRPYSSFDEYSSLLL